MNFLILDTSTNYCSVALLTNDNIYSDTREMPRQHSKCLLEMIKGLFDKADIDKKSLDFVAYGVGPGSFVGVRLAGAVCQGFAAGLNIPIIGFSSMFAIAKSTSTQSEKVAVILDAKMGDFYLGLYDKQTDQIISEDIYKLSEYSLNLHSGYQLIGESIVELGLSCKNEEIKLDVCDTVDYASKEYFRQKQQNLLTQETFPVYFRGTNHWNK